MNQIVRQVFKTEETLPLKERLIESERMMSSTLAEDQVVEEH